MTKGSLLLSTIGLFVASNADAEVPRLLANSTAHAASQVPARPRVGGAALSEATRTVTAPGTDGVISED